MLQATSFSTLFRGLPATVTEWLGSTRPFHKPHWSALNSPRFWVLRPPGTTTQEISPFYQTSRPRITSQLQISGARPTAIASSRHPQSTLRQTSYSSTADTQTAVSQPLNGRRGGAPLSALSFELESLPSERPVHAPGANLKECGAFLRMTVQSAPRARLQGSRSILGVESRWLAFHVSLIHHREEEGRPPRPDIEPSSPPSEKRVLAQNVAGAGYNAVMRISDRWPLTGNRSNQAWVWCLGSYSARMPLAIMVSDLSNLDTATGSLLLTDY